MERKTIHDNVLNAERDQIIPDWNASTGEPDEIKNKPVIKTDAQVLNKTIETIIAIA